MELGSAEHKQLLVQSILRTAKRTAGLGLFIGILLILPSLFRENAFSTGLAYLGWTWMIGVVGYAGWISWRKYQRLIRTFDQDFKRNP